MGLFVSRLVALYTEWGRTPARILMLGLDAAGKTTVLYKLKLNENVITIPTIGFNVETVEMPNGLSFTVWDVGGQETVRRLWGYYYTDSEGLIYVVDSNDPSRLTEASEELHNILADDRMRGVPVLVLANKQDLPNSRTPAEVADRLGLSKLSSRDWHVQGCCANTGDGLIEGISKLSSDVKSFKSKKIY